MRKRTIAVLLAAVAVLAAGIWTVGRSVPAEPAEIAAAIDAAPAECRDLTRARIMTRIADTGAISRRQLEMMAANECSVAGPQFRAASGRR